MQISGFIYADAGAYKIIRREPYRANRRNFVGYIAHEKHTSKNQGVVDVIIAWRGTITKDEWLQVCKSFSITAFQPFMKAVARWFAYHSRGACPAAIPTPVRSIGQASSTDDQA